MTVPLTPAEIDEMAVRAAATKAYRESSGGWAWDPDVEYMDDCYDRQTAGLIALASSHERLRALLADAEQRAERAESELETARIEADPELYETVMNRTGRPSATGHPWAARAEAAEARAAELETALARMTEAIQTLPDYGGSTTEPPTLTVRYLKSLALALAAVARPGREPGYFDYGGSAYPPPKEETA